MRVWMNKRNGDLLLGDQYFTGAWYIIYPQPSGYYGIIFGINPKFFEDLGKL